VAGLAGTGHAVLEVRLQENVGLFAFDASGVRSPSRGDRIRPSTDTNIGPTPLHGHKLTSIPDMPILLPLLPFSLGPSNDLKGILHPGPSPSFHRKDLVILSLVHTFEGAVVADHS
jgi:hypothetical protein